MTPREPARHVADSRAGTGTWYVTPERSSLDANAWLADAVRKSLIAFEDIARATLAEYNTLDEDAPAGVVTLAPSPGEEARSFAERIAAAIASFAFPVHTLTVSLETRAFVPGADAPEPSSRVWLDAPADLTFFSGPPEDRSASFTVGHSLFRAPAQEGGATLPQHELNPPYLERALKAWESQLGPITQAEGVPDVRRYGFAAPGEGVGPVAVDQ